MTAASAPDGQNGLPFPILFSPITIGTRIAANRIMCAAHEMGYLRDGMLSDRALAYYRERAAGGAGLIVAGPVYVSPDFGALKATDPRLPGWLARLSAEVREHGTLILAQLTHPGRQGQYSGGGAPLHLAPSAVPGRRFGQVWRTPHEMSAADIREAIGQFAQAAQVCREAGLDGVELQFAHGNLVDQFLSAATNLRSDEWGGDTSGRLRFALQLLDAVREKTGPELIVGARISAADFDAAGGHRLERLEMAGHLDETGLLDYFSATVGHYSDDHNAALSIPDMTQRPGTGRTYASDITHLVSVPVAAGGRVNHPAVAEEMLDAGDCDLVAMARALIADPALPRKARAARTERIRPCIGAVEGCQGNVYAGRPLRCVYNPVVGRELQWADEPPPAPVPRTVLIVGGGPAGLECARVCALRGHTVTLLEQNRHLGGQVAIASRAPHRGELSALIDWLAAECRGAGVDIHCGVRVDRETVESMHPDAAVVATGVREGRLDLPQHPAADVRAAWRVLLEQAPARSRCTVLDQAGDRLGSSVAEHLAEGGAEVTVVTPMRYPGQGLEALSWPGQHQRLARLGVRFYPLHEATEIGATAVTIRHTLSSAQLNVPTDITVTALLPTADDELYRGLAGAGPELVLVGDALAPRGLEHATYEGHAAALAL